MSVQLHLSLWGTLNQDAGPTELSWLRQRDTALLYLTVWSEIKNGCSNPAKYPCYLGPDRQATSNFCPFTSKAYYNLVILTAHLQVYRPLCKGLVAASLALAS